MVHRALTAASFLEQLVGALRFSSPLTAEMSNYEMFP